MYTKGQKEGIFIYFCRETQLKATRIPTKRERSNINLFNNQELLVQYSYIYVFIQQLLKWYLILVKDCSQCFININLYDNDNLMRQLYLHLKIRKLQQKLFIKWVQGHRASKSWN